MSLPYRPVVVHTSWRGRLVQAVASIVLVGVGIIGFSAAGEFRWVPAAFVTIGVIVFVIQLIDFPLVTVFDEQGIERRCLLRRNRLAWDDVETVARPGRATSRGSAAFRRLTGGDSTPTSSMGLVAEVGEKRRRHLLTDRIESQAEFDELARVMHEWAPMTMRASRPAEGVSPSFLYKRRRGTPDALPVDRL